MKLSLLLLFLLGPSAFANPQVSLHKGDQLAQDLLGKISSPKEGVIPFYQGIPPSPHLSSPAIDAPPAAHMVRESSLARPQFKIDPLKDPLLVVAEKLIENALLVVGKEGTKSVQSLQGGKEERITCEESGETEELTCKNTLSVPVRKTTVQKEWKGWFHLGKCSAQEGHGHTLHCHPLRHVFLHALRSGGSFTVTEPYKTCLNELAGRSLGCGGGCQETILSPPCPTHNIKTVTLIPHPRNPRKPHLAGEHFHRYKSGRTEWWYRPHIKVTYEEESVEVLPDVWTSTCEGLEDRADQGLCTYGTKLCTQGPQTRVIEGIPITRECWEETYTYHCHHPSKNDCGPLRGRGCAQVNSDCKQRIGTACVVYTQTYQCKSSTNTVTSITGGSPLFCLDGNCRDQGFEPNEELLSSLAQLHLLKDMQGTFEGSVFKGTDNRCSKATLSFKDCCGSGRGWGVSVGLAGCSGDERALSLKRQKGLCHFVGTYCSQRESLTRICLQKKSTYCCFGSKLLKAFHEQGRPQIGLRWGSPEAPLCRGLTVDEIQRIDFSRLDLKEAFEDLIKSYQPAKLQNVTQKLQERLEAIKQGMPSSKGAHRQRPDA